jgi:spore coat polysaccharide biosynthesis predicted glycosyltransferase SpsG
MRIVLRADATESIGVGHIMRSLAIIDEFVNRGFECVLIGNVSTILWLHKVVLESKFSLILENESEYEYDSHDDVLIIDSYTLPIGHKFLQKEKWKATIAIVDSFSPMYSADLRIHIGLNSHDPLSDGIPILSGPSYIPIRKLPRTNSVLTSGIEILVSGGSNNPNSFVEHICHQLMKFDLAFNCYFSIPSFLTFSADERFHLIESRDTYLEKSANSEIIFCTAGYSSLEFVAYGKAIGISCAVPNQQSNYLQLVEKFFATPVSFYDNGLWKTNLENMKALLYSKETRDYLRKNTNNLIDLNGSKRVVDAILNMLHFGS